jgi:hypothetical protein
MLSDDDIIKACIPYTLTSEARLRQTIDSISHIVTNNIEGDIIEVGVWRGGSVMAMLFKLAQLGVNDRKIHLYDTFEGMTPASPKDLNPDGIQAEELCRVSPFFRCIADISDVKENIKLTGYPTDLVCFHKGDVRCVTTSPEKIACLRLDVDWYELYKHCLPLFTPNVSEGGPITIDDYGYWSGCKEAVDEFLKGSKILVKIDETGVYWHK